MSNKILNSEILLHTKDLAFREKIGELEHNLEQSRQENTILEVKYLKKVKNDEDRKQNLEKYHKNHQEVRKGLQETLESAVENQEKWVPCARQTSRTGQLGKPKGARGGGRHRPEDVAKAIHMRLWRCPHCDADLSDRPAYVSHTHIFTDLENVAMARARIPSINPYEHYASYISSEMS